MTPETRYAKSGDVSIAYQCVGDGSLDLVLDVTASVRRETVAQRRPAIATIVTLQYRRRHEAPRLSLCELEALYVEEDTRGSGCPRPSLAHAAVAHSSANGRLSRFISNRSAKTAASDRLVNHVHSPPDDDRMVSLEHPLPRVRRAVSQNGEWAATGGPERIGWRADAPPGELRHLSPA